MKAEKLLEKWEKEIDKRWIKHKLEFLWYGFWGDFKEIREIVGFEEPRWNKIAAFIGICDSRIDRLKSFSRDLMMFISVSAASLAIALSIFFEKIKTEDRGFFYWWFPDQLLGSIVPQSFPIVHWFVSEPKSLEPDWIGMKIIMIALFILILLFALLVWRYRAQANAWYAVKEGVLLMKKNK